MKKILLLGAGGPVGILLARCLKNDFDVYGTDDSEFASKLLETKPYNNEEVDLIIPLPDSMIKLYADKPKTFLPSLVEIALCQDKAKCAKVLDGLAPKTLWIRDIHGAGGKGCQMASEYLPGKNYCVELLYKDGKFWNFFIKERISYATKERTQLVSGYGSAAVAKCIYSNELLKLAKIAVLKISKQPNGVYSIDFKENENSEPKITEINAGRFTTSSYVFYYKTSYNLPRMMIEVALGLPITSLGEYPEGKIIIRQIDKEPYIE